MLRSVSSLFLINATCRVRATFDLLQVTGCLFSVFSVSAMYASLMYPPGVCLRGKHCLLKIIAFIDQTPYNAIGDLIADFEAVNAYPVAED